MIIDVGEVIDIAKRKLEKEREMYMSKSLPGFGQDGNQTAIDNESDSESDSDESDEKGMFFCFACAFTIVSYDPR